jgi:hypothetical protein
MKVQVVHVDGDWLRGRLAECREELASHRPEWEIRQEIEELEWLLASDGAA